MFQFIAELEIKGVLTGTVEAALQPQSVPGVPNPRVSLPREVGDVRSKIFHVFFSCFSAIICLLYSVDYGRV